MTKGVVSSRTVPGCHREHVANGRSKIGHTAVLRIVDDERHDVGTVLGPQIRDVWIAAQIGESSAETYSIIVQHALIMDEVELGVDPRLGVARVGFLDGEVDSGFDVGLGRGRAGAGSRKTRVGAFRVVRPEDENIKL